MSNRLFIPVSNSRLVLFRVLFGLVMTVECAGSIFTGRVNELFVETPFNFPFIGFEWLAFLHGAWMNYYYALMALAAAAVAAGLCYRLSSVILALLWSLSYFAEKTHYNNHYYLMLLLCWIMVFMPAHRRFSLDARLGYVRPSDACFAWQHHLFIAQIWIVYTFAGIAKLNPDWLVAMPLKLWMPGFTTLPLIGPLFRLSAMPWIMAYFGLTFDLVVVPALLWKKTKKMAFCLGVFFHLSNSLLFGIGTFPYLAISLCVFFASPEWLEQKVLRRKSGDLVRLKMPARGRQRASLGMTGIYLLVQLLLPIRHWFIAGNVNWTEEGHRMAWRMMLRSKNGGIMYRIRDARTGREWTDYPNQILAREQFHDLCSHPDIIWQYARYLKRKYQRTGIEPQIYAQGCCSLNGKSCLPLIDPAADLAAESWQFFSHNRWITGAY